VKRACFLAAACFASLGLGAPAPVKDADAPAPHTPTLAFLLTGADTPADAAAIRAAVQPLKSVSKVAVDSARSSVQVRFDSHVVSYHQVAQAIRDAGTATGKNYAPRLKLTVPDYAQGDNAAKVDAIFAGKRLNTRVRLEPLDKARGEFLVHFLALTVDPADPAVQGFNGGHLNHPLHDPPPRGLGLACIYASTDDRPAPAFYAGLRRSSYGLRRQNANDLWWTARAKTFAAQFPGAQPLILHILSTYQDDGSTEIEFRQPAGYRGPTTGMSFQPGKLHHEQALAAYDAQGVKAILQFEPGAADVGACFEIALTAFGRHPCVAGLAIDAEWFRTKESADQTGLPVTDADAQRWMEQVLRFNPAFVLVLKHFEAKHLPPHYRHPNLWLLTDSQEFATQTEWLADMHVWQDAFSGSPLGVQYGYPKDRKWWSATPAPPVTLGRTLLRELPGCRLLLWVDFTADQVEFLPQ
jgi:copper chaperone CopZ